MPRYLLVVDDDPAIRRLLNLGLRRMFEVVETASGEEALSCIEKHAFDLVISDVMMPGMSGVELCRQLKQRGAPALPVVLLTALDDPHDREAGLAAGAAAYITKPLNIVQLVKCLEKLLA